MTKTKKGGKEEEAVYVGIEEPDSARRNILEASKALVHVLKSQHSINLIRVTKHKLIEELRARVSELNQLITETRQMLPQMENAILPAREKPVAVAMAAPKKEKQAPAPKANIEVHVDKFERELQDIEKKLKTL